MDIDNSVTPRARINLYNFVNPSELHGTATVQKHWNRVTIYAKTRCALGLVFHIHALVCRLYVLLLTLQISLMLHKMARKRCWSLRNHLLFSL